MSTVGATMIFRNFNFEVTIPGVDGASAIFSEVSGFDATYDVAEYRAGSDDEFTPRKFPGLVKYGNVTLKKGVTQDLQFMDWVNKCLTNNFSKQDITIVLKDPSSGETGSKTWYLKNAWAVKYTGPDLNGTASEIAMETIEICHEGLQFGNV